MLRPVSEADLTVLDRILADPAASGPFQWYGWRDPFRFRRRWADNGLLGEDGGTLMVVHGADVLGFVAWHKVVTSMSSYCWNVGIGLLPEFRGRGYGTGAQRLLVRYLFAHTQVQRIHAFRLGAWHDTVLCSVLRHEVETSS